MKIKRSSIENGIKLYELAVSKYLNIIQENRNLEEQKSKDIPQLWIDLSGQIIDDLNFHKALQSESIPEMEKIFEQAANEYELCEKMWVANKIKKDIAKSNISAQRAPEFDEIVETDRKNSLSQISKETEMHKV